MKLAGIRELKNESVVIQCLSGKILYVTQDKDLRVQRLKVDEKTIKHGVTKDK